MQTKSEGMSLPTNKGNNPPKDITILNIYSLNVGASEFIKTNTSEHKGTDNRHNNSGRSKHPTFINRQDYPDKKLTKISYS
jgi:hypothetical protein